MLPKILTCIILALALPGCVSVKKTPTTQATLADDVFDATTIYLAARPSRAGNVLATAERIKAAAESNVDASVLRSLAVNLMLERVGGDEDDKATAAFIANLIVARIHRRLGLQIDVELVPDGQLPGVKAAVIEAADAAILAARPFAR